MQRSSAFCKLTLPGLLSLSQAVACTVKWPTYHAGPNFRVEVQDHGRPVRGLQVVLRYHDSNKTLVTQTDDKGFARFQDVPPGSYWLTSHHDAGIPDTAEIQVEPGGPDDFKVSLQWPAMAPITVRSLKGVFHGPSYGLVQRQPIASLQLLEGFSGRLLETGQTTPDGAFDFSRNEKPGFYFVSLQSARLPGKEQKSVGGLIGILVDPAAPADQLNLDWGWTSCGPVFNVRK